MQPDCALNYPKSYPLLRREILGQRVWVIRLTYRRKAWGDHSMAEKRGQVEIGETEPRKTRMTWSKLDCLNPNPDRGICSPIATPIMRCHRVPSLLSGGR